MEPATDFGDWELLHNSNPSESLHEDEESTTTENSAIRPDHFSLNPTPPLSKEEEEEQGSIDSDNPSWIDPDSDSRYQFLESSDSEGGEVGPNEEELGSGVVENNNNNNNNNSSSGGVWWKMPMEILRMWVLRARPVWSVSIAAAVIGIVMLGRRLYRMKQKSRSVAIKLAIDDKKASQFMTRAARLNEAFSVVKRVPMIRPSLPAGGVTPWPMVALR